MLRKKNLVILLVAALVLPLVGFKCEKKKTVYIGPGDVAPFVFTIPDQESAAGTIFSLDVAPWIYDYEDAVIDMTFTVATGLGSFTGSTYNHTYGTAGSYSVDFTVEDTGGNVSAGAFNIEVYDPPVAEFMANMMTGVVPFTVQFTDLSSGDVDTRSWDFGDMNTSTEINPSHTYDWPGTYTVILTVTGPGGNDTETKVDYITVNPTPPVAAFSADVVFGNAPLDVDFTDESTGDIDTWSWDFGDGSGTSSNASPSYQYTDAGVYDVSLTVSGPGGTDTYIKHAYIHVLDVSSNIWYVDSSFIYATGTGTTWLDAFQTIWSGIDAATDGDIVYVADGTYIGASNRDLDFGGKNIYLQAYDLYGTALCTINCENNGRAFYFYNDETNDAVVDGFTIINGNAFDGAGIFFSMGANPTIINCTIKNCAATYGGGIGGWGATGTPVIENCTITDNYASENGGGIFYGDGTLAITNCSINENYADGSFEGGGGCFFWFNATVYMDSCDVLYNEANNSGGGIHIDESWDSLIMDNCNVDWNTATYAGGGIFSIYSNATLTNCSVCNNMVGPEEEVYGAGIAFIDGLLILDNCDISDNSCPMGLMVAGGGIFIDSDTDPTTLIGTNCTIDRNSANAVAMSMGGGIFSGTASLDLTGCSVSGNTLDATIVGASIGAPIFGVGGGICIGMMNPFESLILDGCVVSNNSINVTAAQQDMAMVMGGGVCAGFIMSGGGDFVSITNTIVADNSSILFAYVLQYFAIGGGLAVVAQDIELENITVLRNRLSADGIAVDQPPQTGAGGVLAYGIDLSISDSTISNNQISGGDMSSGGGLFAGYTAATITDCNISDNSVDGFEQGMGGGLFASSDATTPLLFVEDCIISGNRALGTTALGGGVYVSASSGQTQGEILNCLITGNSSEHYGGGLFLQSSDILMPVCTIAHNSAGLYGGGVFNVDGYAYITHSIIWGNTAVVEGNQVFDPGTPTVELEYTILPDDTMDPNRFGGDLGSINEDGTCINADPVFAAGPKGNYYLDQLLSPGVDAGSPPAATVDMDTKTTAPDGTLDSGQVDLGYHYEP